MPTLIFTYTPRPDVPFDDFEKFLREVDQPATLSLPSAKSSRILRVHDEGAPFGCIEILEITSFEEWERDTQEPSEEAGKHWATYVNLDEMKLYHCEEFYAGEA